VFDCKAADQNAIRPTEPPRQRVTEATFDRPAAEANGWRLPNRKGFAETFIYKANACTHESFEFNTTRALCPNEFLAFLKVLHGLVSTRLLTRVAKYGSMPIYKKTHNSVK
jgi:hypothetical protein